MIVDIFGSAKVINSLALHLEYIVHIIILSVHF